MRRLLQTAVIGAAVLAAVASTVRVDCPCCTADGTQYYVDALDGSDANDALTVATGQVTNSWTGNAGDGKWETGGNWSQGHAPTATEDVTIAAGSGTITVDGTRKSVKSVDVQASPGVIRTKITGKDPGGSVGIEAGGNITIGNGNTIQGSDGVGAAGDSQAGGDVEIKAGGTVTNNGTVSGGAGEVGTGDNGDPSKDSDGGGVKVQGQTVTNSGSIKGGKGGNGDTNDPSGNGGPVQVAASTGDVDTANGTIEGGSGGASGLEGRSGDGGNASVSALGEIKGADKKVKGGAPGQDTTGNGKGRPGVSDSWGGVGIEILQNDEFTGRAVFLRTAEGGAIVMSGLGPATVAADPDVQHSYICIHAGNTGTIDLTANPSGTNVLVASSDGAITLLGEVLLDPGVDLQDITEPDAVITALPCGLTVALHPVGASGPATIEGNRITLEQGGVDVLFDVLVSGWDPDQDGVPAVKVWQTQIDSSTYTNGLRGELTNSRPSCVVDEDCPNYAEGEQCQPAGYCGGAWQDCPDRGPLCLDLPACDVSAADPRCGSTVVGSPPVADDGSQFYAMSLRLSLSPDAAGCFRVGFLPEPATFLKDENSADIWLGSYLPGIVCVETGQCCDMSGPFPFVCLGDEFTVNECAAAGGLFVPNGTCDDPCGCQANAHCDDGDACTDDSCNPDGTCANVDNYDSAVDCCDPATGATCPIDDGNECTADSCSLGSTRGYCVHEPEPAGTPCDDGFDCVTVNDACDGAGYCVGEPLWHFLCEDHAACQALAPAASCDTVQGVCVCALPPPQACCFVDGTCQDVDPQSCTHQGGSSLGDLTTCQGDQDGNGIDDACPDIDVPTTSQWGVIVMGLLLLTVARVYSRRRWSSAAAG